MQTLQQRQKFFIEVGGERGGRVGIITAWGKKAITHPHLSFFLLCFFFTSRVAIDSRIIDTKGLVRLG